MKTYLAKFKLYDGEHEHYKEFLVKAPTYDEAVALSRSQEHEPDIRDEDEELTYWDYGDGTTSSRVTEVIEITEEEAAILQRYGLAFYFN